ncbi:hypothetical protein ABIB56_001209 [Glaciihabitans sp. UYNi722]
MVWLIVGGIGILVVVAAACVWAVVALLAEVGDEQDPSADDSDFDSTNEPPRGRSRVIRF